MCLVAKIKLSSLFYDSYFDICRIHRKNIDLEEFRLWHLPFLLLFALRKCSSTLRCLFLCLSFYDYDEPIGMCSRLIIHNLTRVSSGTDHRLHAACFRCRFYSFRWHAAGNEDSDRLSRRISEKSVLILWLCVWRERVMFQIATLRALLKFTPWMVAACHRQWREVTPWDFESQIFNLHLAPRQRLLHHKQWNGICRWRRKITSRKWCVNQRAGKETMSWFEWEAMLSLCGKEIFTASASDVDGREIWNVFHAEWTTLVQMEVSLWKFG